MTSDDTTERAGSDPAPLPDEARGEAPGGGATVLVADAAEEAGVAAMFAGAAEAMGGLDGLVLNVGIGGGWLLKGTSVEEWDRVLAVNLRSQFLGCKHALEAMPAGGAI